MFGGSAGAFAEYVGARNAVVPKPANVTFEEAAAVPTAGLTALQGLATNQQAALSVPGYRPSGGERITLELASRSQPGRWDLHLRATLGGQAAKPRVHRESVRAGLADLLSAITRGTTPSVTPADAWTSLATALAAAQSATTGTATRPARLAL